MWRPVLLALAAGILACAPNERAYAEDNGAEANQTQTAPIQPPQYYSPCRGNQSDGNSDLCAQWTAAKWAKWSFFATLVASVGLLVTLWFNLEAWRQARKAETDTETALLHAETSAKAATSLAETVEKSARAELRAYLDFNGIWVRRWPKNDISGSGDVAVRASVSIKNYGKTPAENLEIVTKNFVRTTEGKAIPFTSEDKIDFSSIAPTDEGTHHVHWPMPNMYWAALEQRKIALIVSLIVTYTDVFGKPHILRSDYETMNVDEELGFVRGTRKAT